MERQIKKNNKNNEDNKENKGCRGCKYLYINPILLLPYECWYPRGNRLFCKAVDLERLKKGCKGRKEDE